MQGIHYCLHSIVGYESDKFFERIGFWSQDFQIRKANFLGNSPVYAMVYIVQVGVNGVNGDIMLNGLNNGAFYIIFAC